MVLLVVDTQELITNDRLYAFDRFTQNVQALIGAARDTGTEIVYIRHDDGKGAELTRGKAGYDVWHGFAPRDGERIFDKRVNSPFRDTGLLEYLKEKHEDTLIVTGLQTDYCIDATVKCGFEHHFDIIVPAYANTTVDNVYMTGEQTYRYYNEHMWNRRYARCIPTEDTIRLMRR